MLIVRQYVSKTLPSKCQRRITSVKPSIKIYVIFIQFLIPVKDICIGATRELFSNAS